MGKCSYGFIALNDVRYIKAMMDSKSWQPLALQAQQVTEKLLKHVIEKEFATNKDKDSILCTHKIRSLVRFLSSMYDMSDLRNTSDIDSIYSDTRYPSDDYYLVTEEIARACLDYLTRTIRWFNASVDINTLFNLYLEVVCVNEELSSRHTREFLLHMIW